MSENSLDFKINGARNMDILYGLHGRFTKFQPILLDGGIIYTVRCEEGEMYFQIVPTRFGSIAVSGYHFDIAANLSAQANTASLELMHMIEGAISFTPDGIRSPLQMKPFHWQLMHLPHVNNKVHFPAGTKLTTLDIHVETSYLENLATFFPHLDSFLLKTAAGKAATISQHANPFSNPLKKTFANFLETKNSATEQSLFLERHLTDWLASAMESSMLAPFAENIKLTAAEEKRLHDAFEFMMANLDQPITIAEMAHNFFINEYKFKNGFKLLFKKPPHQLLTDERLKKAMELLVDTDLPVIDISMQVGYQSYAGFSKEFKKKYSVSPTAFRKTKSPEDPLAIHLL